MPLRPEQVTAAIRESVGVTKNKRHKDGRNLYLVARDGRGFWVYQYRDGDTIRSKGLGSAATVTPAKARQAREAFVVERRGDGTAPRKARARRTRVTFGDAVLGFKDRPGLDDLPGYIATHAHGWKGGIDGPEAEAYRVTLTGNTFAALPLHAIDADAVSNALGKWKTQHRRTAEKIRGRIERVLDYATALKLRSGDNPATIKLQRNLGLKAADDHTPYAALPAEDVADLMGELDDLGSATCKALQFTILTAARSGEVIGATWGEINLAEKTWTVGPDRMKEGKAHTVPLTAEAIAVLGEPKAPDVPLFANKRGKPLHDHAMQERLKTLRSGCTVHGFRSVASGFWAKREVSKELRDLCLAHAVGGKTFAAYNREELIELRRPVMEAWAKFATVTP